MTNDRFTKNLILQMLKENNIGEPVLGSYRMPDIGHPSLYKPRTEN